MNTGGTACGVPPYVGRVGRDRAAAWRPRIDPRRFIVVSGLPASGKTTVARELAPAFELPLFDKDDILEALFDAMGSADLAARHRLSRASDRVLSTLVARSSGAVVTSFWRHPRDTSSSGTPCDWLRELAPSLVEVYCQCAPELAVQRFLRRSRHPGHHDAGRTETELLTQLHRVADYGPLGVGRLIVFDTSTPQDVQTLIREIAGAFGA